MSVSEGMFGKAGMAHQKVLLDGVVHFCDETLELLCIGISVPKPRHESTFLDALGAIGNVQPFPVRNYKQIATRMVIVSLH